MAVGMIYNFTYCSRLNKIPRQFLFAKWFFGSFTHQGRRFHNSPTIQDRLTKYDHLIDQGKRSILKLKTRDNIPKDYHLIYKASMELTMRVSYPTYVFCAAGLFGLLIYNKFNKENLEGPKSTNRNIKFLYPEYELWIFSAALLLMSLAAFSIMFKYPFRIYKHSKKKEYIAIYIHPVPPMLKRVEFTSATPTKFKNPFYFFMAGCHYVLDCNKRSFMMGHFFRVPKDLTDMCEKQRDVS